MLVIYLIGILPAAYLIYSATGPVWRAFLLATLWPGFLLGVLLFFCHVQLKGFLDNLPENKL